VQHPSCFMRLTDKDESLGWRRVGELGRNMSGKWRVDLPTWSPLSICGHALSPQTSHLSPSRFDRSQDPLVPSTHDPASTSGHPMLRTRPRAVPEGEQPHEGDGRVLRRPPQPPMWSPLGRKRDLGAGGFVDTLLQMGCCTNGQHERSNPPA